MSARRPPAHSGAINLPLRRYACRHGEKAASSASDGFGEAETGGGPSPKDKDLKEEISEEGKSSAKRAKTATADDADARASDVLFEAEEDEEETGQNGSPSSSATPGVKFLCHPALVDGKLPEEKPFESEASKRRRALRHAALLRDGISKSEEDKTLIGVGSGETLGHLDAYGCIVNLVSSQEERRLCVATQDARLRQRLR